MWALLHEKTAKAGRWYFNMTYTNQYLGLDKPSKLRTTFEIGITDVAILRSYDPKDGTLQTTASILFKKLIHELQQSNIQPGDFSAYQSAICNCTISLNGCERSTASVPSTGSKSSRTGQATGRDVRRGASSVARKAARSQELPDHASAPERSSDQSDGDKDNG